MNEELRIRNEEFPPNHPFHSGGAGGIPNSYFLIPNFAAETRR